MIINKSNNSPTNNNSGQAILEMILIMTLFFGVSVFVADYFKKNELLAQIISKPWDSTAGLIQNGVWAPIAISSNVHPNFRPTSVKGETPK